MKESNSRQLFKNGFNNKENMIVLTDEQLNILKKILKDMFYDIQKVLDENSIRYTLSGGSVLGALRHEGFIPWDDDIDINMPRKDYEKFLKIFDKELGKKYLLCSPELTHNHGMLCAQIKKKGTKYRSFNELSKKTNDCGICMDIFVVENTFDNCLLRRMHGLVCLIAGYVSTCKKTNIDMPYLEKYLSKGSPAEKAFRRKAKIGSLFKGFSLDLITHWARNCYALCKNENSKYVTIPSGRKHYFGELHLRSDLCESRTARFEGMDVKIPKGSEIYMEKLYGSDYMQLPSIERREKHPLMEIDFGTELFEIKKY